MQTKKSGKVATVEKKIFPERPDEYPKDGEDSGGTLWVGIVTGKISVVSGCYYDQGSVSESLAPAAASWKASEQSSKARR